MTLIIAEKPSVAMSIAKVLSIIDSRNSYMDGAAMKSLKDSAAYNIP